MTSHGLFRAELLLAQSRLIGPVLGLETGGPQASLAVASHGAVLAVAAPERKAHGETVVGAIDALLREAGVTIKDLAAIAVGIGPGSFTGLRIALSYAKGVALATGCGVVGIPSLDALALCALCLPELASGTTICPILDARKGELYAALYRAVENGLEKLSGEFLAKPQDLAGQIELAGQIDGQVVYLGDGVTSYGDALRKEAQGPQGASGRKVTVADLSLLRSSAAMIAALGAARVANGRLDSVSSLQPLYVRPSEAELKAKRPANAAGLEALWSKEKKSSSASMQTMMKS
jgi:tRNA threonylcarbamoyladenosine biosynthesis protein TsaB